MCAEPVFVQLCNGVAEAARHARVHHVQACGRVDGEALERFDDGSRRGGGEESARM